MNTRTRTRTRAALALAAALGCASANADSDGIGTGSWHSVTPLRGVHVALRASETPNGPRGVFCAHRADGTTLAVPWGAGEPIPVARKGASSIDIEALGVTFQFRRTGEHIAHTVISVGTQREGAHILSPTTQTACAPRAPTPSAANGAHRLTGTWRGVYRAPAGPAVEIQIGAGAIETPAGTVCLANGNGSMVYWTLESVGARADDAASLRWARKPVPAGLKERTSYSLRALTDERAVLSISTATRRAIELRRGLSSRGCTAVLRAP